jgi:beta-fructofuranosidase
VIDSNNTSGFFPNQTDGVVAIYTLNTPEKQTQDLAISYDGGYTFTEYENNPVIDINSTQFRDPKVIWYEDHWVMVIAYSVDFSIGIYTSTNLIDWEFSSNVTDVGIIGLQYECPNLIPVPVWDKETGQETGESEWVLIISINPGAPLGGSISEWFPGSFDGYKFTPYDSVTRISDFAKDNYAEQFFYGTESNEAISIAWASNWQYTNKVPTATEGWRSAMSLPRRNYVTKLERTGWAMISQPYELSAIYDQPLTTDNDFLNKTTTVDFSNVTSGAIYLNVNISVPTPRPAFAVDAVLNFTFSSTSGESVTGGYFFGGDNTGIGYLDRGNTNGYTDVFFNDKFTSSGVALAKSFSVVVDRSILEMFVDEGAYSGTTIFFPETPLSSLEIATSGIPDGVTMELEVWGLKGTWGQ